MQFCIFCILSSNHMFAPYHAMTLPFCHIPKNNLRNTLSLILHYYIYLLQKAGNKDFVFKKIRFLVQDTRKFDCKAQIKMQEILFFSENKVVLLMYKQNKCDLINQICGMTPFLPSPLKTSKHTYRGSTLVCKWKGGRWSLQN